MIIFRRAFVAGWRGPLGFGSYVLGKWRLRWAVRDLRAQYGLQAASIAQEMGADCAQAGALKDAIFWLRMAQQLKRPDV
ncbi:MAG: hypothetical protein ABJO09_06245 [Hyphomicrobiales bacterium]